MLLNGVCSSTSADDTDLYVSTGNDSNQNRPQVLIIFDNSGSMATEEAVAVEPFDPSVDYTPNGGDKIFYVRGTVAIDDYPDPQDPSEWRYFYANNNACAQSLIPHPTNTTFSLLDYEGRFTSNLRFFKRSNRQRNNQWNKLPEQKRNVWAMRDSVIDCKADLEAADPNNAPMASGSHNLARLAVPTLRYRILMPSRLQRVQVIRRAEALDRRDRLTRHCRNRRDASFDCGPVDMHGAGATETRAATKL
jgi:hypothetical protein